MTRREGSMLLLNAAFSLLLGCQILGSFEDFEAVVGTGGASGAPVAGSGGGLSCPTAPSDLKGTEVVLLSQAGECVWMDKYEVSRAQYDEFLKTGPSAMPSPCDWKTSGFVPECGIGAEAGTTDSGATESLDLPVTCVDWCDALAYCQSVGKTLCKGEYNAPNAAAQSDWFAACSQGGQTDYPYGKEYKAEVCNGGAKPKCENCTTEPVAAATECRSPEGIVGLSGNVAEWVAECASSSGGSDSCHERGGSYLSAEGTDLACSAVQSPPRKSRSEYRGFRCCAYAK